MAESPPEIFVGSTGEIVPGALAERPRHRGLVLTGGGARAAYQVGLLRGIGRQFPDLDMPVITGISAGAINAVFLAGHDGNFAEATDDLARVWRDVTFDDVFRTDLGHLAANAAKWSLRLASGGRLCSDVRGLLDTDPLRRFLERTLGVRDAIHGIGRNLARGRLHAAALATLDYRTGETVTWVQGDPSVTPWRRPQRHSQVVRSLTVEHVMASSALPILFPAIKLGGSWYGDGGIRLAAPISPALHLDADRDADRIERLNKVLVKLPPEAREGMRLIDVLLLRPSCNLGRLVDTFEAELPRALRFLTRGLGTREANSADFLSLLMFQGDYLDALIATGEQDAASQAEAIAAWVGRGPAG